MPSRQLTVEDLIDKDINEAFAKAQVRGKVGRPQWSTAPMDESTILKLVRGTIGDGFCLSRSDPIIRFNLGKVTYGIQRTGGPDDREIGFIQFTQCSTPVEAEQAMKGYLSGYQRNLADVVQKSSVQLGSYCLQDCNSVFWIRDTVFVQVESGSLSDDTANLKIPHETILKIAQRLDQHLAQHSVAAEQQKKPHPELDTANPFKVRRGETFNLKLKNLGDVHKSKRSQIDNPKLIIQLSNGTDEGAYPFIARDVGMTKVKLMVAHKTTLAVGFKEVEVIVVDG
ncbi:hypothetical protein B0A49_08240 [Cryomyces minteri]|uniref:Uncharacterized protein n=1 Tax=Cryomyces minteri TaxID=331657 RepID=A0A4U0X474_9PEZI|nr:hypothetical protein B0A49_08240 [Cryomyces minteri]